MRMKKKGKNGNPAFFPRGIAEPRGINENQGQTDDIFLLIFLVASYKLQFTLKMSWGVHKNYPVVWS
jgi:hypothetical protein